MTLYGLRLLVALLTFAVGVTAAWLFNFKSAPEVTTTYAVHVRDTSLDAPPHHSCPFERGPVIAGGILNGKAISKPSPVYPPSARETRVSGTVVVAVVVDESGNVESAEVVSGPGLLHYAAVEAASAARFSPTRLSGKPVKVSGTLTYNFVLP